MNGLRSSSREAGVERHLREAKEEEATERRGKQKRGEQEKKKKEWKAEW